ncbi:3816_t:CDS:2 [Scutellospora calospora]|uniref:3816_t:CDS:1 n=1 Tax=Scutellospora calospora TaxID=85575 RepID=A0ACA9KNI7_9GLOM|nr:3816_t:CDS:2 [Scutellospora calospora]
MDQLNNLTFWDVKDALNKVKNVVMNYTEMEAKVREATNNEPWGASSTLMQEIAQGTYSYQSFNEIMTTIYKRFTEKEARQWRQIYKALQLLEYLVKHGSERVVDDARAHMATIKIMRNFTFIDDKGKDQGINVRSRAKELAELLSDVEKIRQERRKAKANKTKYTGVSSDAIGYGGSSSRYGGFGNNDTFYYSEDRSRSRYDEPDSQWQIDYRTSRSSLNEERRTSNSGASRLSQSSNKKIVETSTETANSDEPATANTEVNLFDFDDTPSTNPNSALQNDFGAMQTAFIGINCFTCFSHNFFL